MFKTRTLILASLTTLLCLFGGLASAALVPVLEYSFPASYDASTTTIVDLSSSGNDGAMDGTGPLTNDRPAGFSGSLMSLTGATGGHGDTNAIDLLNNTAIEANGGFTFDVWMKWEGTYTNTRKQIDYAGTEYLRTEGAGGEIDFVLSNGLTILSYDISPNVWYHVRAEFDTQGNTKEADGAYPGEFKIAGDARLYVDGVLRDSATNVVKTGFGDSLNRPIGINRWAGGGADWNQGWIFNPTVSLGIVPEPSTLLLSAFGLLGPLACRRRRR